MNYLVHVYSLLCALEITAFGKKRGDFSFIFHPFVQLTFCFLLFYSFPESVMFSSKLFTHKEVVRL